MGKNWWENIFGTCISPTVIFFTTHNFFYCIIFFCVRAYFFLRSALTLTKKKNYRALKGFFWEEGRRTVCKDLRSDFQMVAHTILSVIFVTDGCLHSLFYVFYFENPFTASLMRCWTLNELVCICVGSDSNFILQCMNSELGTFLFPPFYVAMLFYIMYEQQSKAMRFF